MFSILDKLVQSYKHVGDVPETLSELGFPILYLPSLGEETLSLCLVQSDLPLAGFYSDQTFWSLPTLKRTTFLGRSSRPITHRIPGIHTMNLKREPI